MLVLHNKKIYRKQDNDGFSDADGVELMTASEQKEIEKIMGEIADRMKSAIEQRLTGLPPNS